MSEKLTPEEIELGPFDPRHADDPHELYERMREHCPVARSNFVDHPTVFLSHAEDVRWAMRNPETFSSAMGAVDIGQERPLIPLQLDPPEHGKFRRLLDPEFAPRHATALEADTARFVDELIDGFVDAGGCDFHADFATPLPTVTFLRLMGLPEEDLPMFLAWRDNIIRPATNQIEEAQRIREATGQEIYAYFEAGIDRSAREPGEGLFSRLLQAEVEGERLTREQILDITYLLMLGGLDTVTATLDCAVTYLAAHPEHRRALAADPALVPSAVEELLRWESPVVGILRTVKEDVELSGVPLCAGDHATLVIGAANTDEAEFEDAGRVHLDRSPNRHLSFGGGPHRCLGSHLARMELRVALAGWHRRIPEYAVAPGAQPHFSPGIRQTDHLPLVFSGEQRASA